MKEVKLSKGQVAQVDDWRYEEVSQISWHARWDKTTKSFYAVGTITDKVSGKEKTITMHRFLKGFPKGKQVDHEDQDTLNNQEHNLRVCTNSQNMCNRKTLSTSSTGYKGVREYSLNAYGPYYAAEIQFELRELKIGSFSCPHKAALAYNLAAVEVHKEFAWYNTIPEGTELSTRQLRKLYKRLALYIKKAAKPEYVLEIEKIYNRSLQEA